MKLTLPFALLFLLSSQVEHQFPERHVKGILEAPEIFGEYPCDRYEPRPVTVYAGPFLGGARMGVLEVLRPWYLSESSPCEAIEVGFRSQDTPESEPIRYMEFGYEESGLIVAERSGEWFEIVLPARTGWIHSAAPERFHAYPDLVSESLAYVNRGWPGLLWSSPETGTPREISESWRPYTARDLTIEVLDARTVNGDLWFKIRLDSEYGCGTVTEDLPTEEGWVPGYGNSGENLIWFHSRGC